MDLILSYPTVTGHRFDNKFQDQAVNKFCDRGVKSAKNGGFTRSNRASGAPQEYLDILTGGRPESFDIILVFSKERIRHANMQRISIVSYG